MHAGVAWLFCVKALLCPLSRLQPMIGYSRSFSVQVFGLVDHAEERTGPEDVGDHTLIRGL